MAELYSAAYHGNVNSIKRLLARGADVSWRHPHGGATALYVACEFGHAEAAKVRLPHAVTRLAASLARLERPSLRGLLSRPLCSSVRLPPRQRRLQLRSDVAAQGCALRLFCT